MSIFTRNDSTSKLQTELARLEKKRAALGGKLVAAESAAAAAQEARRRHLIESEDIDASAGVKFSEAVDAAQRDMTAISGAISELDSMIQEGKAAVTAAREAGERQKRAAEIEARIKKLEPLCAEAEKQFESLLTTLNKIAETADDDALALQEYHELRGHGDRLPVTSIIGAALAQAIFRDMPDLLIVEKSFGASFARVFLPMMIERYEGLSRDIPIDHGDENSFTPKKLSGALTQNIIEPLRAAAAEIVDDTRALASNKLMIDYEDAAEPIFDWSWLVFIQPAIWTDWRGETVTQADSRAMVPEPVARAALAAGVAFPEDAPEAVAHEGRRYQQGYHSSSVSMTKDVVTLDVKWPETARAAA